MTGTVLAEELLALAPLQLDWRAAVGVDAGQLVADSAAPPRGCATARYHIGEAGDWSSAQLHGYDAAGDGMQAVDLGDSYRTVATAKEACGWHERSRRITALVLAAPCCDVPIRLPDGPLIKQDGTWSLATCQNPDVRAALDAPDITVEVLDRLLGPHEQATLTADGRFCHSRKGWCICRVKTPLDLCVRYERYTDRGREAHGLICPACRRLVQSG
ncbi:MAG TPA: hypothetical protein VJT31_04245 [Rugosimonospora sp.]|nr:hypothetical protein [Rugosimonospora sp.]